MEQLLFNKIVENLSAERVSAKLHTNYNTLTPVVM